MPTDALCWCQGNRGTYHITLLREVAVTETLWSHPLDREFGHLSIHSLSVVVSLWSHSGSSCQHLLSIVAHLNPPFLHAVTSYQPNPSFFTCGVLESANSLCHHKLLENSWLHKTLRLCPGHAIMQGCS